MINFVELSWQPEAEYNALIRAHLKEGTDIEVKPNLGTFSLFAYTNQEVSFPETMWHRSDYNNPENFEDGSTVLFDRNHCLAIELKKNSQINIYTQNGGGFVMPRPANEADVGRLVAGKGVFLGVWEPVLDKTKIRYTLAEPVPVPQIERIGKVFNVYAAPEDVLRTPGEKYKEETYFDRAREIIPALKGFHGHNGVPDIKYDKVFESIKDGSYNGEWFLPQSFLLQHYVFRMKDSEGLRQSFQKATERETDLYMSCTRHDPANYRNANIVKGINFKTGRGEIVYDHCDPFDNQAERAKMRLIRLEPL